MLNPAYAMFIVTFGTMLLALTAQNLLSCIGWACMSMGSVMIFCALHSLGA